MCASANTYSVRKKGTGKEKLIADLSNCVDLFIHMGDYVIPGEVPGFTAIHFILFHPFLFIQTEPKAALSLTLYLAEDRLN